MRNLPLDRCETEDMRLTTGEIAAITGGRLVGADVTVDGATQDSRSLRPGQLFVPLVDARDGHDFIGAARAAGAAAHLTERDDDPGPAVWVADTRAALDALGRWARDRLEGPVVGITGSVGKTSTKDLLAAAVAPVLRVGASAKSFNNEIGVPLTLVGLADDVEVAVLEMGARAAGGPHPPVLDRPADDRHRHHRRRGSRRRVRVGRRGRPGQG